MASLNDITGLVGNSRAAYINLLKIMYLPMWNAHVHEASELVKRIASMKGKIAGERLQGAVTLSWPQSSGQSRREGVRLPRPTTGTHAKPEFHPRNLYSTLQWTGDVERSSRGGNEAAFAEARMKDIRDARLQFDINYATKLILGYYEARARMTAAPGSGVLTLASRNSRNASDFWNSGRNYLRVNQDIGVAATVSGASRQNMETTSGAESSELRYISAVGGTNSAPNITVATSAGVATDPTSVGATDYIVPWASRASSVSGTAADDITTFASFNGLFGITVDSTQYAAYAGLAKSSYPTLNGVYRPNPAGTGTTRPFEERQLHVLIDTIRDEGIGTEPDFLWLHSSTRREVVAEHSDDRRYAPILGASGFQKLVAHVGDKALPYDSDFMMMPGIICATEVGSWGWYEQSALGPIDQTSERWVEGYDAHSIVLHKSGNIVCENPFNQGALDDIDVDVYDVNV